MRLLALLVLAVLSLVACGGAEDDPPSTDDPSTVGAATEASAPNPPAGPAIDEAAIRVEATQRTVGDGLDIEVTVTNDGDVDLWLPRERIMAGPEGALLGFLADDNGDEAPPGVQAQALPAGSTLTVGPDLVTSLETSGEVMVCVQVTAAVGAVADVGEQGILGVPQDPIEICASATPAP